MSGWTLALVVDDPRHSGTREIKSVRELTAVEHDAYRNASAVVTDLNGHNLTVALVDALNAFIAADSQIVDMRTAQDRDLRTKVEGTLDSFLAAVTSFRSKVKSLSDRFPTEGVYDDARSLFDLAYASHPAFRLAWELRNASQHDSGVPGLSRSGTDRETFKLHVDAGALFASRAGERRWDACAALWPGATLVEILPLLEAAYQECQTILGKFLLNRESTIDRAAETITKLFAEAQPTQTNPIVFRAVEVPGAVRNVNFETSFVDMLAVGYMVGTLDGARTILGLEPIDRSVPPTPPV